MPNLKDIRRRIQSVKSTQKITQAMRMVAAAKVKRAENRVKAVRPFSKALQGLFRDVYLEMEDQIATLDGADATYLELLQPRPVNNVGIVVISSDRGLCGAFNSNIIRQTFRLERELLDRGVTPKFYLVGQKIIQSYSRYGQSSQLGKLGGITAAPSVEDANTIVDRLVQAYKSGEIDSIEVLSTHFVSMISYQVRMSALIPVREKEAQPVNKEPKATLEFMPDAAATLDKLIPMYLSNALYSLLLESSASELAARMTAMANATNNAKEMIDQLTIQYNKARQASITQEILEVVSGAQALS